ncbi:hypothetical protein [Staphylococcus aureus]|uniref:Uncharacterized protein n=2 Tax=Staphylococcus aureus TaxID=1280 RepID=A0A0N9EII7_STAAU|nr:hypothetical protein [Staphylococcus aureus]ALF44626.1 hypothetical protein [Staphylococcus aureus]QHW08654.1 hypothetical protein [Staphylococcus aureus]WLW33856.1 hypothetical protein [Staphylococcus aureus]WLW33932.1 hypothetical protein [Staphylococcus aureus]HDF0585374.1 hypothetical protein [Staphylococcus aureus]
MILNGTYEWRKPIVYTTIFPTKAFSNEIKTLLETVFTDHEDLFGTTLARGLIL